MSAQKAFFRYAVFYKTTISNCGKVVSRKEERLGTTIAVSEKKAISNMSYRTKLPIMSGCDDDGKGYARTSIMKARKIGDVK